ncbi:MAG: hypothetical protein BZY88_03310 [SAR202 cluster bacterium Io17-Chloro-G9]|nr:MAG: hypothetical protein BZY88_03310 [SAR202 cluster bacterium Io17-Chloro-G9]
MTAPEQETIQEPEVASLYQISFERIAELNRSAISMVADRRPPTAPSRNSPDSELTDPKKLVDEIATHCADDENFIRTEMPIQEIVFRVLLARRNTPTLLSDLHYELTEKWSTPVRPINISESGLGRILDSDTYYGFART